MSADIAHPVGAMTHRRVIRQRAQDLRVHEIAAGIGQHGWEAPAITGLAADMGVDLR